MVVKAEGADVLTKQSKEWKDVCYNLKGDGASDDNDDDDDGEDGEEDGSNGVKTEGDDDSRPGAVKTRRMRDQGKM